MYYVQTWRRVPAAQWQDRVAMLNAHSSKLISCHRVTITTDENESSQLERPLGSPQCQLLLIRIRLWISVPLFGRAAQLRSTANQTVDSPPLNKRKSNGDRCCCYYFASALLLAVLKLSVVMLCLTMLDDHVLLGNDECQTLQPLAWRALRLLTESVALGTASRPSVH